LGIVNDTGEREHDTWCRALGQALVTDLSQISSFEVVPGDQTYMSLKGLDMLGFGRKELSGTDLQKVARRTGAFYLVTGRLSRENGRLAIQMDLKEAAKGRSLITQSFEVAEPQGLLSLVDDIAVQMRQGMPSDDNAADSSETDRAFQEYTTSSPKAYAYYAAGKWHQWNQDYRSSIDASRLPMSMRPSHTPHWVITIRAGKNARPPRGSWTASRNRSGFTCRVNSTAARKRLLISHLKSIPV
jgi:TolB-like protein